MAKERLQKVMAAAGVASRRHCEELILEGAVRVNGHVMDELPAFVDPQVDKITVNRKPLKHAPKLYYLLNKPKNVICTNYDPQGRPRAIDILGPITARVFCVGRLETESTGLLIITNDSILANHLTHPAFGLEKKYMVKVTGKFTEEALAQLKKGIWLSDGKAVAKDAKIIKADTKESIIEITLVTGLNRQIKRMLAKLGFKVKMLMRTHIGKLTTKGLGPGQWRKMDDWEVTYLKKLADEPKSTK